MRIASVSRTSHRATDIGLGNDSAASGWSNEKTSRLYNNLLNIDFSSVQNVLHD